jgi:hypothetical protein
MAFAVRLHVIALRRAVSYFPIVFIGRNVNDQVTSVNATILAGEPSYAYGTFTLRLFGGSSMYGYGLVGLLVTIILVVLLLRLLGVM